MLGQSEAMSESRTLIGADLSGPPILFGTEATQAFLVDLLRNGPSAARKPDSIRSVLRTGLIAASGSPEDLTIALNDRHPAIGRLREVLAS